MLSDGRVLRTHIAEAAPSVFVTGHIIHRPMPRFRESLSRVQVVLKIIKPFINKIVGAIGKPPSEASGELLKAYLSPFYDNAFHFHIHHNLPGEGIEGHLVGGVELVEPIIAEGGSGGFMVDDEDIVVDGDDPIEMATEHVLGLGMPGWAKVQSEAE